MSPFLVEPAYLVGHLAIYLIWVRETAAGKRELGIFTYHIVSYLAFVLAIALGASLRAISGGWWSVLMGAALHGLYSLSFLELWSLTHRGYSLAILNAVERAGGTMTRERLAQMEGVGAIKQAVRADLLRKLGLVKSSDEHDRLTNFGRLVSAGLSAIVWLSQARPLN
jgi:hypothetical protein